MKTNSEKIVLPDFFRTGIYISSNFDFVDPTNQMSIIKFMGQQAKNFKEKKGWLFLYRVNDINYVKACVEEANSSYESNWRLGWYLPETIDEPTCDIYLENGEYVVKEISNLYDNDTENKHYSSYDDSDIIRIIGEGGGEAHGYGD